MKVVPENEELETQPEFEKSMEIKRSGSRSWTRLESKSSGERKFERLLISAKEQSKLRSQIVSLESTESKSKESVLAGRVHPHEVRPLLKESESVSVETDSSVSEYVSVDLAKPE